MDDRPGFIRSLIFAIWFGMLELYLHSESIFQIILAQAIKPSAQYQGEDI